MTTDTTGGDQPVAVPQPALALWRELAGDPDAFAPGTVTVVRDSRGLCPEGWSAVLTLGEARVVEAGEASDEAVERLLELEDPTDPDQVVAALGTALLLGPAELAYLPDPAAVPEPDPANATIREAPMSSVVSWLDALPAEDVDESSVADMAQVVVAERGAEPLGVAGHLDWPAGIAHMGLIVAPEHRGQGLAVALGAAATRRALGLGLTPQWRAAIDNQPSRAVARRLGYVELGRQLVFQLKRA